MAATAIKVETPSQIRDALAARRRQLGLRQLEVDDLSGCQSGYCGKLEKDIRGFGDMSLSSIMGALGLQLFLVERPQPHQTPKAILGNLRDNLDRLGLDLIIVAAPRQRALPAPLPRHYADRQPNGD